MGGVLVCSDDILTLQHEGFTPLWVDFNSIKWQKRRDAGKKQGLIQACKPVLGMRIVDATAGWGRDAAVLASFGAQVLMLERHPMISALLSDGLRRLSLDSPLKLSLLAQDAHSYLESLTPDEYPEVILIDPMHPARQKSALVKKDMQVLQQMIGEDKDVLDLLHLALKRVRQRVVVKWQQRTQPLLEPTRRVNGKTIRFDIFTVP